MTKRVINSGALYFRSDPPHGVPIRWLTTAMAFFSSQGISIDYFDIDATEAFSPDETYDFERHKNDLFKVMTGCLVQRIGLYSNPYPDAPRSAWQAMASVEIENGMMFLGIDEAKVPQHGLLLRSAYLIGGELLGIKYGISYKRSQAKGPESYAAGVLQGSLTDIWSSVTSPDESNRRIAAWRNEKYGTRRYLSNLFRGAYPASIVSREHLEAIRNRVDCGQVPGRMTPLVENQLWIWELRDPEMIAAEKLLHDGFLLIE